jgi:trehalose transport system substrate-binding protein
MDPRDWYAGIDVSHRRRAFTLAWRLCRSEETAVERIIPTAVEIAYKSVRRRMRRERDSATGWKIMLSDAQLLQIGILEAAEREGMAPQTGPWLPYIAALTLRTLQRSSFSVAVGFGQWLTNGSRQEVLKLFDFLDPGGHTLRETQGVRDEYGTIHQQMCKWLREHMPPSQPQLAFTEIPKRADDARYQALAAMVPWERSHLPDTYEAFSALQEARRRVLAEGLNTLLGRSHGRRRRRAAAIATEVEVERAHVCICQEQCLERVKRWGGFDTAFARWRLPAVEGMEQDPDEDPWQPPGSSDWNKIDGDIMKEIVWRQWLESRRGREPNATFEVRVDGQVQAVITPARRHSVTLLLPAFARYVEIQDPERQVVVATCHLMDPHDLPRRGWRRAVPLSAGGILRFTLSATLDPGTEETGLRMTVEVSPRRRRPAPAQERAGVESVRAWWSPMLSLRPPRWAIALIGLMLMSAVVAYARLFPPQVTMAVSYSDQEEVSGIKDVGHELEGQLGAKLVLRHTKPSSLVRELEEMVAAGTMKWDLISVDNDILGILVQKGLVQNLSQYKSYEALIPTSLLHPLEEGLRVDGRFYFVPFRPNVKLIYYNQDMLKKAGHDQPPATWEALRQLTQDLASDTAVARGRVAIQAHPGKAAAVTAFEWVKSMGGDPLTLADAGARQAFTLLWNLAPYLEPESTKIQFNTANDMLIDNEVAMVSNWTYGIKVVMENAGKTYIKVAHEWPEKSKFVLGGDVLAIPQGAPHPDLAIKLIERLISTETQHTLAARLFWAPVREDAYAGLSPQEYFQVIRKALGDAVPRPTTPGWVVAEEVLSDALQEVLRKGREQGAPATAADIDALLRPFAARLQEIPREYIPCAVVAKKTARAGGCEVEVQTEKSFEVLARDFKTTPAILAKVNGRRDREPVSPANMQILLVPKHEPRN